MAAMRLAASLGFTLPLAASAVRLVQTSTNHSGQADADAIFNYFNNTEKFPTTREAIKEAQKMDGDGTNMKFKYLDTKCLKARARWAAKEFENAGGCTRLLEIGGYLTPFPTASTGTAGKTWGDNMELYVNADPSAKKNSEDSLSDKYPTITLQIILQEWAEATTSDKGPLKDILANKEFDCFLMLGVWDTQVGTEEKRGFLEQAIKQSKIAILESPQSDPNGRNWSQPVLEKAGFEVDKEFTVDCSFDAEAYDKNENPEKNKVPSLKRDVVSYVKTSTSSSNSTSSQTSGTNADGSTWTASSSSSSSSSSDSSN